MKRIVLLIGWMLLASGVAAQSWSLDDCMKYAVGHATDVKRETINARQRKQDYHHAFGASHQEEGGQEEYVLYLPHRGYHRYGDALLHQ